MGRILGGNLGRTAALVAGLAALGARPQAAPDPGETLRARCEQAAALLAAGKAKEAAATLGPLLKDPAAQASAYRDWIHYQFGCAAVATGDDAGAGRALSRLTPFDHPHFAAHARYLLGRIHHRAGEYTEAAQHYDAIPASHEKQLAAARQALQNPQTPSAERARLEAFVKGAPPEFLAEALFHKGMLLYEQRRFADALQGFTQAAQKDRRPAWVEEARLRIGMCQFHLGRAAETAQALQPLLEHPRLARQARWWTAQALLRAAPPRPGEAADLLRRAAAAPDAGSVPTQGDLLVSLGEALERAGRGAEAIDVYQQLLAMKVRGEEALARLTGAYAAAKRYREVDEAAARFEKAHPESPLLGEVLLRRADAAFVEAQAAPEAGRQRELHAEALRRYERVFSGGAAGPAANAARYRMALAQYRLGRLPEAAATLRAIPDAERTGELAGAFHLQAECLLRAATPADEAADALTAARTLQDLQEAAEQLQKFVGQAGPQAPEAAMKLGHVLQEIAALLADKQERARVADSARQLYEAFRAQFPNHALRPVAEYERANCYALAGDPASAIQKLERFRADPFAAAPVAPLALLRQAQLYRSMGQPAPAAAILGECRARHEPALAKDPARASWIPLLRFHHAAALKEAKQAAEAAKILDALLAEHASSEWTEPARRLLKEIKP